MENGKEAGKYQVNIETLKAGDETIAKELAKLYTIKVHSRTMHPKVEHTDFTKNHQLCT